METRIFQNPNLAGWLLSMTLPAHDWIRETREDRGLRQTDVERLSAEMDSTLKISQSHLSKIEKGHTPLAGLGPRKLDALRQILRVTPAEWLERTGLELVTVSNTSDTTPRRDDLITEHDIVVMPVYGLCEAGKPVSEMEEDPEVSPIGVPRKRWRPGALVFRVQGESMQKEDGRGINPDDLVMVDTRSLDLTDGKVYVIHIPGSGVTLKRVRFLAGQAWLFSDNPNQQEFPPFQVDDARILGRVYSKISVEAM